jgi:integrase
MTTLRLPFIHSFVDRHGRARYYFRHRGRRWPLPAPGTPGFLAEYEACKSRMSSTPAPDRVAFLPGSLGWAIEKFLGSDEFKRRAENTKRQDRRLLDELKRHAGAGMLKDLRPRHVKAIRDHFRQEFTASIADAAVARISIVWNYADEFLQLTLDGNPAMGVKRVHKGEKEHEPWPDHVIAAFEAEAVPAVLHGYLILRYSGQRVSDVVKMRKAQFDGAEIEVKQQKTKEPLRIPCHVRLRQTIEANSNASDFLLVGERGRPLKAEALSAAIRRTLARCGIKGYSAHGLRKNAAQELADAGCDIRLIMAVTGHRTMAMALHYFKRADQRRAARAAVEKWEADGFATGAEKHRKTAAR